MSALRSRLHEAGAWLVSLSLLEQPEVMVATHSHLQAIHTDTRSQQPHAWAPGASDTLETKLRPLPAAAPTMVQLGFGPIVCPQFALLLLPFLGWAWPGQTQPVSGSLSQNVPWSPLPACPASALCAPWSPHLAPPQTLPSV